MAFHKEYNVDGHPICFNGVSLEKDQVMGLLNSLLYNADSGTLEKIEDYSRHISIRRKQGRKEDHRTYEDWLNCPF